jgi:hypothetical protein
MPGPLSSDLPSRDCSQNLDLNLRCVQQRVVNQAAFHRAQQPFAMTFFVNLRHLHEDLKLRQPGRLRAFRYCTA